MIKKLKKIKNDIYYEYIITFQEFETNRLNYYYGITHLSIESEDTDARIATARTTFNITKKGRFEKKIRGLQIEATLMHTVLHKSCTGDSKKNILKTFIF